jgi:nucleoside-diphosphate-sugar epimerase/predicted dehydrogenase
VLVEKPLAEDESDARKVAALARARNLFASVNHSLLYDPQIRRALRVVRSGRIGDVVSVDILRGSSYPPYEGGALPPWYRSAGYPFRDLGVHCMYLLQELLGPIEDVTAKWQKLGGDPRLAFDEWRAVVRCERGLGQFQITWNAKPMQSQLVIHGTRGILRVDLFAMFHSKRTSLPLPSPAERLVNAVTDSVQPLVDVPLGVIRVARREVQAYQGLRDLVADFYRRLAQRLPPPVALDDAIAILPFVERVARDAEADHAAALGRFARSVRTPIVVTGASGALGSALVDRLVAEGRPVRAFVRRIPRKPIDGVEYCFGDLGDPSAVEHAVEGAETVIHAGAAMKGGWAEHLASTVVGTRNVVDACRRNRVRQLVHVSSMSVIHWLAEARGAPITESTPLEPRPEERGAYTRAKLEAERVVAAAARDGLPSVILRPGQIFGGGVPLVNGAVARRIGKRWVVLGDGGLELPLVYIDDVVDAVLAAIARRISSGEVIQLVDDTRLTQAEVLALAGGGAPILKVPRALVFALGRTSDLALAALGLPSPIGEYRLRSALAETHCASGRARALLGWQPRVGVREGIRRLQGLWQDDALDSPITMESIDRWPTTLSRSA